jgi:hypothetical protein
MVIIKEDRKVVDNCTICKHPLLKHHPHHFLCQKCWEKKQEEQGRMGYVDWSDRKKMLRRGKI